MEKKKKGSKNRKNDTRMDTIGRGKVAKVMHERKEGTLRSGSTGKRVTSKKQAVAIGLSEARKAGAKVPKRPARKK